MILLLQTLFSIIRNFEDNFNNHVAKVEYNEQQKHYLKLKRSLILTASQAIGIIDDDTTDDVATIERAVNKYSFHLNHFIVQFNHISQDSDIQEVNSTFEDVLNDKYIKALTSSNEELLLRILRMYACLGKIDCAENIYRERIVDPILSKIFTKSNLDKHDQNLSDLYEEALKFLNEDMNVALEVCKK